MRMTEDIKQGTSPTLNLTDSGGPGDLNKAQAVRKFERPERVFRWGRYLHSSTPRRPEMAVLGGREHLFRGHPSIDVRNGTGGLLQSYQGFGGDLPFANHKS